MKINLEQSTEVLSQILEKVTIGQSKSWVENAFDAMTKFKTDYKIENCSTDEESDELLVEYGTYNWNPEENSEFEFTLTRQIQIDSEEEYYQIKLKLTFDPVNFNGIESMNFWTMDYENMTEWKSEIEKTKAFLIMRKAELLNHEVSLDLT